MARFDGAACPLAGSVRGKSRPSPARPIRRAGPWHSQLAQVLGPRVYRRRGQALKWGPACLVPLLSHARVRAHVWTSVPPCMHAVSLHDAKPR
jgi:hypothetical protein